MQFFQFSLIAFIYIYIYIYIYHHHHHHHYPVVQLAQISLSLNCHSSLSSIALDWSSSIHPVSISQHWHIHLKEYIGECHLWICPCFSGSIPHALFSLFGCFLEIGVWWPYNYCFVGCCVWDLFNIACSSLK